MAYTVAMAGALLALQATPAGAQGLQWAAIAALGFSIYGPQMLIGLSGAELVAPGAVGASQGILGWIAYLGAANAGACCVGGVAGPHAAARPLLRVVSGLTQLAAVVHHTASSHRIPHSHRPAACHHHHACSLQSPSGIPLSHVVQSHGWGGFFTALLAACAAALVLLTFVANAPSYQQREASEAAKAKAA
jgi:sugar phosphate permease